MDMNAGRAKEQSYCRELIDRLGCTLERLANGMTNLESRTQDVIRRPEPSPNEPKELKEERQPLCYIEERLLSLCQLAEARESQLSDITDRIAV